MTRQEAIEKLKRERNGVCRGCAHPSMVGWCENHCKLPEAYDMAIDALGQPEIIYCGECKHNPKLEWFGCPASHLSEKQKPDNAWCWRGERRTDE